MARNLIGTGADQVSVNGMLGELAFQSKENVNFTGGTGKLSKLDIDAISAQLGVSAVDVFVYDTKKDSDGGAWRKRCTTTSWYNETLNTTTRGSRKDFPSVAIIVATAGTVTIYDGDDPTLPMWMVINSYDTTFLYTTVTSVFALNGIMCVGVNPNGTQYGYWDGGVKFFKFISDDLDAYSFNQGVRQMGGIVTRNATAANATRDYPANYNSLGIQLSYNVNDVWMYVSPAAPLDTATGLPVPTVAAATVGGLVVIQNDGTAVGYTHPYGASMKASIYKDEAIITHNGMTSGQNVSIGSSKTFNSIGYFTHGDNTFSGSKRYYGYGYYVNADNSTTPQLTHNFGIAVTPIVANKEIVIGGNSSSSGIIKIAEVPTSVSNGLQCVIKKDHNSGWMPGSTKGAWLSSSAQETLTGAELVTNGTFDSSTTGWTLANGSTAINAGVLSLTKTGAIDATFKQTINTIVGKTYVLSVLVPTAQNNYTISVNNANESATLAATGYQATTGTIILTFTATTSTSVIILQQGGSAGAVSTFDNVSVRIADADRSVNNKGLHIYGSISKVPVAIGSDLVGYSGFSGSNYLQQPYNSALNFGTGDFCAMAWMRDDGSSSQTLAYWGVDSDSGGRWLLSSTGSIFNFYCNSGSWQNPAYAPTIRGKGWCHVCFTRKGTVLEVYVNGIKGTTGTADSNIASSTGTLRVGYRNSTSSEPATGSSIALLRISAVVPTLDQILKIYNDEKMLFEENAKATIYGTSDAVTATTYDEDTQLLHVGTSSGRSVFQGLRRVDNTTTAVTTSISAANGMVAEQ